MPELLPADIDPISTANSPMAGEPPPARPMLGGMEPQSLDDLMGKRSGALQEKLKKQGALFDETEGRLEQGRTRMQRAFEATSIQPGELLPWDDEQMREKFRINPMESFGSLATVAAIIASAFTKAPLENALNGAAAAMNGIREGKEEEFKKSFDAWKANTDLAFKRHNLMQQNYSNALSLFNTDMTLGRTKLTQMAAQYDDQQTLFLLQNGMDKEVFELLDKRNKVMRDSAEIARNTTADKMREQVLQTAPPFNAQPDPNDPIWPIRNASEKLMWFNRIYGAPQGPEQQLMGQWLAENPRGTADDMAKFYETVRSGRRTNQGDRDMMAIREKLMLPKEEGGEGLDFEAATLEARKRLAQANSRGGLGTDAQKARFIEERKKKYIDEGMEPDKAHEQAIKDSAQAANVPRGNAVDFERMKLADDYIKGIEARDGYKLASAEIGMIQQAFGSKSSNAPMKLAQLEAALEEIKNKQQGGEKLTAEQRLKIMQDASAARPTLSPNEIDVNAHLFIKGNPAATTNVGRGVQGGANLGAIKGRAADILVKERGMSPEEAASFINMNTAGFMGDKRGASALALRMSQVVGASTMALATADRVTEASEVIDRTQFPDLNKVIMAAQQRTGGEDVIRFGIAVNTLVNNYARAIGAGSATLTDTARNEAHELLSTAYSKGQIRAAIDQMKKELKSELSGADKAMKYWRDRSSPFEGNDPDKPADPWQTLPDGTRIRRVQ